MNQIAIDFASARADGDRMAGLCLDKAEEGGFDTEGARDFVLRHLARHGDMSGEALTEAARDAGFIPHDDRAFGAVFGSLSRRGLIRCAGFCARKRGHGTAGGRIWSVVR